MITKDKIYRTKSGLKVKIYEVYSNGDFPVHGAVLEDGVWYSKNWTLTGALLGSVGHSLDIVEYNPWKDIKIDTKVIWTYLGIDHNRYFAGVDEKGFPMIFRDGKTSWTTAKINSVPIDSLRLA